MMSGGRGKDKLSGWAAFDLKQRQDQGLLPNIEEDPFPPMTANMTHTRSTRTNNNFPAKPFSEVLKPDVSFPPVKQNKNHLDLIQVKNFDKNHHPEVMENRDCALKHLKDLHHWAANCLIMDGLSSGDNDINKASTLLKEMAGGSKEVKDRRMIEMTHSSNVFLNDSNSANVPLANPDGQSSVIEEFKDNGQKTETCASRNNELSVDAANMKLEKFVELHNIVAEPEWEEDDVYLIHRRDALRMMRSASRHSRAAANAFMRGDRFSAQQHAMKAEEDRLTADRLNARAARDILSIRNSGNDLRKLDLHGLHAAEAVQALEERLKELENLLPVRGTISQNGIMEQNQSACSSSADVYNSKDENGLNKEQTLVGKRPQSLEVITGIGNNSRGAAALPVAVRSFLIENRYRFSETRPGVVTVWIKFRRN